MPDISTGSTATCRYCGHEIVYQPWFLDGRDPNPPVWSHVKSGVKSCSTRPVSWEADRWPFATPAAQDPAEAATVRDAARQTTGQQVAVCGLAHYSTDGITCTAPADHHGPHAGPWIEDGRQVGSAAWDEHGAARQTTGQTDTGEGPDPCSACPTFPCRRCAAPAVGQPAEAQAADEAHPAQHRWAAELHDPLADEWVPGTRYPDRDRAVAALAHARAVGSTWKDGTPVDRRLVRETTTWTVEDER